MERKKRQKFDEEAAYEAAKGDRAERLILVYDEVDLLLFQKPFKKSPKVKKVE